jgi:hypothetical protein
MPKTKDDEHEYASDQDMLDEIKKKIMNQIKSGKIKLKVGDLLKIFEIQKRLSSDTKTEEKFWEVIEQIRQEELKDE